VSSGRYANPVYTIRKKWLVAEAVFPEILCNTFFKARPRGAARRRVDSLAHFLDDERGLVGSTIMPI
jgi:hypothetical protein